MKNRTNLNYFLALADKGFVVGIALIIAISMLLSGCDGDDDSVACNENPNLSQECVQEGTGYSGHYVCGIDGVTLLCDVPSQPATDKPCSSRPNLNAECGAKVGSGYVPGHFECADPTAKVDPVCTPDDDAPPDSNPVCTKAVYDVKAWSYKASGCASTPQLSGAVQDAYGTRQYFKGTALAAGGEENVELKDDGSTCGPIKVSLVGNTGNFKAQMSEYMKIYSLNTIWVDWAWQKVYNNAPTAADYDSDKFAGFLLDLFECERGTACSHPQVHEGSAPPNPVVEESINDHIDNPHSGECVRTFFVLVQK